MKQIVTFFIIGLFTLLISCNKEQKSIIGGNSMILGQVLIPDTISLQFVPLGHVAVKLGTDSINFANFIISDTTDQDGYFKFSYVNAGVAKLYLTANYLLRTNNYKLNYSGRSLVRSDLSNYEIKLQPDSIYGNFLVQTKITYTDLFSNYNMPASNCTLIIYPLNEPYNQILKTTSSDGIAYIDHLKAGSYTIKGTFTQPYQGIPITYNLDTTINLSGVKSFNSYNFLIPPKTIATLITFVPGDSPITPQPGVSYCIFSSSILFHSSNCSKSNASGQSNTYGKALLMNLSIGAQYFISAFDSLKTTAITAKDSFTIFSNNSITYKTVLLK